MTNKDLVFIALFAAITAALGILPPITLPFLPAGVPITAQSMGPMLAGSILGFRRGGLSQLLFVILVAIGLPLLSGGRGGMGVILGATGGFIISWVFAAFVIGYGVEKIYHVKSNIVFALGALLLIILGGIIVVYLMGGIWLAIWNNSGIFVTILSLSGFMASGIIKVTIATIIAVVIRRSYPMI